MLARLSPSLFILLMALWPLGGSAQETPPFAQRLVQEGIAVEMSIEPVDTDAAARGALREGDDVIFRFTITDTATGTPLSGIYPAAWMDLLTSGEVVDGEHCVQKVEQLISGNLMQRAELDLNVYYVLALNEDATITVVDPLFGYGSTKLLAQVTLLSPGEDWALGRSKRWLFVSQPDADRIAVVDTARWEAVEQIDAGPRPRRLHLQGDGAYLWAALDGDGPEAGVAVIDARTFEVVATIATGAGPHDIVLDDANGIAFVSNGGAGTVSVIEVATLRKRHDVATGRQPVAIDFSPLANAAYVSHQDGTIAVVVAEAETPTARMEAQPGLGHLRFAPGGRHAFVANPETDQVHVVDAARNRIVQTGRVQDGPDQITFSDELAYIRHRGSEIVLMIPLTQIGNEGQPLPVVDFPGGQEPFGLGRRPSLGDTIVQAPGATAVLVANPADKMIYFYKEGMAAPMGGFRNYERQPRAVLVVDRSLKERARSGVYETAAKLRRPGHYQLAFFLDTPRIVQCFPAVVQPDPVREAARRAALPVRVEPLIARTTISVGETIPLRFRLTDPHTGALESGFEDVNVLTYNTSNWNQRQWAREVEEGIYEVSFTPPGKGSFLVAVSTPRGRLRYTQAPQLVIQVVAPQVSAAQAPDA